MIPSPRVTDKNSQEFKRLYFPRLESDKNAELLNIFGETNSKIPVFEADTAPDLTQVGFK